MNLQQTATRNAALVMAANFFNSLAFILPIWLLYSVRQLHLSSTVAVAVFMAIWFTSGLLEIPTGALADRWGRKRVFIIGNVLLSLYPLAYVFGLPLPVLIAVCLLSGLGNALQSGALLPLAHKSFENAGRGQKAYHTFLSTNHMVIFISRALSGVTGAALYSLNPRLPFLAMAAATMLNVALGLLLADEQVTEKTATNREHIIKTLKLLRRSEVIVALFMTYVLFNLVSEAIWTGYQLLFEADGRSAFVVGVIYSIIAVCSAAGAYLVKFWFAKVHPLRLFQIYGLGVALTAALIWQPHPAIRLLAILPMGVVSGMLILVFSAVVQQIIPNRFHSTALSVISFTQYAVYAIGSFLFGIYADWFGLGAARSILLVEALVVSAVVLAYAMLASGKVKTYRIEVTAD